MNLLVEKINLHSVLFVFSCNFRKCLEYKIVNKTTAKMLPSTGYFKTMSCPFFEMGFCERPFCHFKHRKREDLPSIAPCPSEPGPALKEEYLERPEPSVTKASHRVGTDMKLFILFLGNQRRTRCEASDGWTFNL